MCIAKMFNVNSLMFATQNVVYEKNFKLKVTRQTR